MKLQFDPNQHKRLFSLGQLLNNNPEAFLVGQRPNRVEPRAVKRRPKPYPLLTVP